LQRVMSLTQRNRMVRECLTSLPTTCLGD
jgi:hypothetical protein